MIFRKLVASTFLFTQITACTRYHVDLGAQEEFDQIAAAGDDFQKSCALAESKVNSANLGKHLPETFFTYGECLTKGFVPEGVQKVPAGQVYQTAATCGFQPAIDHLKSKGINVEPDGCKEGKYVFFCNAKEDCGLEYELTTTGYILAVPVLIPVAIVALTGALITLPICIMVSPFTDIPCT